MKKILLATDGSHFSMAAFEFVRQLNERSPVLLTGLFLPPVEYVGVLPPMGGVGGPMYMQEPQNEPGPEIQQSIELLWALCKENGIEYKIHNGPVEEVLETLKTESRYADLMVAGSQQFYRNLDHEAQHEYLEDALRHLECPAVLVPDEFIFPKSLVVAFDGSPSAVFAMKQFAYVLPELTGLASILVHVADSNVFPDAALAKELARVHYQNFSFLQLQEGEDGEFREWLELQNTPLLIAGAFSRSFLSELIKKSFVDGIIRDHKVPLFIAHR